MAMTVAYICLLVLVGIERLAEVSISRHNQSKMAAQGVEKIREPHFPCTGAGVPDCSNQRWRQPFAWHPETLNRLEIGLTPLASAIRTTRTAVWTLYTGCESGCRDLRSYRW